MFRGSVKAKELVDILQHRGQKCADCGQMTNDIHIIQKPKWKVILGIILITILPYTRVMVKVNKKVCKSCYIDNKIKSFL